MTRPVLIENARIVDPASGTDHPGAVLIENGVITDIALNGPVGVPDGAEVINANGQVLAPGLIDMRVFVGEPGKEYRETLASAGKAAVAGGVTSFVMMPDTTPVVDDSAIVDFLIRRAEAQSLARVLPSAAITRGLQGKEITEFGLLKEAGAVCLTDGASSIQSNSLLRSAMSYAANYDMPFVHHVFDADLAGEGVMNSGLFATVLGLKGLSREVETVPLARDLQLALATGVRYHAAQISTENSLTLLKFAKSRNSKATAGVSINNLCLNENDIGRYRTYFKVNPPLRSEDDRRALIEGLRSGVIDTIHSDHDPQDSEVKRRPFAEASNGAIGLETLLAAALRFVHSDDLDLHTVLKAMTIRPAQILGLESGRIAKGAPADLVLIDLDYPWQVQESALVSKSRNTAFEGARMTGKVMRTLVGGKTVFTHQD
ncbi:dihydroorotase [Devosia sp. MC521]|uniref:dihydroorotase n=1 Tax=Devosia sp. MC521 TaxID=2759954 RepID=UPI0015FB195D|nr:dihydroorotase [Devosia sp. MC521]MBJ6986211.1 dihydroorotase [Devosia sp. MC521]QMW64304.1 dihydroorotase [Devosia sp. MC521]